MSIEEYRQKMELCMMRTGIREEESATVAKFLSGLSLEIRAKYNFCFIEISMTWFKCALK